MRLIRFFVLLVLLIIPIEAQTAHNALKKGASAANAGDYAKALRQYQKSLAQLEKAGDSATDLLAQTHYNIGVCLYHLNQSAQAVKEYRRTIELQPTYQKAFRARAMAEIELKNLQAAREDFEDAIRLDQNDGESWFDLALVLTAENDYERAAAAFRQAILNQTISSPVAHNNLGVILALKNDFPAAENEFEKSLNESNGAFKIARNNLEFCRSRRDNAKQETLAKFEFDLQEQNNRR